MFAANVCPRGLKWVHIFVLGLNSLVLQYQSGVKNTSTEPHCGHHLHVRFDMTASMLNIAGLPFCKIIVWR